MWEFIKYCLYCFLMIISIAFGHVPKNATLKSMLVGMATTIVLMAIFFGLLWLLGTIIKMFRQKK